MKTRTRMQPSTLDEKLKKAAEILRNKALLLPPGKAQALLLEKIRQYEAQIGFAFS